MVGRVLPLSVGALLAASAAAQVLAGVEPTLSKWQVGWLIATAVAALFGGTLASITPGSTPALKKRS